MNNFARNDLWQGISAHDVVAGKVSTPRVYGLRAIALLVTATVLSFGSSNCWSADSSSEKKLPVPSAEEIKSAEERVTEIFGSDFDAAKSPEQRCDLAGKLIQNAEGTEPSDPARYVLLMKASSLAAQIGDGGLIVSACDSLSESYEVDVFKLKGRAFTDASKINFGLTTNTTLCEIVQELTEEAAAAQRFDMALPLLKLTQSYARKVKDREVVKQITLLSDHIEALHRDFQAAEKAAVVLKQNPDDAAAALAYGKYLALNAHNWAEGLPLLAKGSDPKVKAAAVADLAKPQTADAQAEVGELWYALAKEDKALLGFYARSHYWYDQALPSLTGLTKTRAEKRLEETAEVASAAVAGQSVGKLGPITAKLRTSFDAHTNNVTAIVFSPDSRTVVTGSYDRDIKVWDVASAEVIKTLSNSGDVRSLAFTPDGKTLISAGGGDYYGKFWSMPAGTLLQKIKNTSLVAITDDGKTLLIYTSNNNGVTIWDAKSNQQRVVLEKATRCGKPVMSSNGKVVAATFSEEILVWNALTGRVVYRLPSNANTMALSPDGKLLASADYSGKLLIWNLLTGKQLFELDGDRSYVSALVFAPDGDTLITGGVNRAIRFWDPHTGKLRVDVPDDLGNISAMAISPNGKTLATGSYPNKLKLWDIEKFVASPEGEAKKSLSAE